MGRMRRGGTGGTESSREAHSWIAFVDGIMSSASCGAHRILGEHGDKFCSSGWAAAASLKLVKLVSRSTEGSLTVLYLSCAAG
jgi:hypothetical protein